MPTSVLLAVLAAAGLLALAPALVRRYDATERLVAERTATTARVLARRRRRRTVPGRQPINPPRVRLVLSPVLRPSGGSVAGVSRRRAASPPGGPAPRRRSGASRARRRPTVTAVHRRRRVLLALLLLNAVELVGVALVGPGFWISTAVTGALLLAYLVHLRRRAVSAQRLRRAQARHVAWIAAQQAAVRREHARRAYERREAARRAAAQREAARREAREYTERYGPRRLAVGADDIETRPGY